MRYRLLDAVENALKEALKNVDASDEATKQRQWEEAAAASKAADEASRRPGAAWTAGPATMLLRVFQTF